jgi:tungstate transport system substrate-binding protein
MRAFWLLLPFLLWAQALRLATTTSVYDSGLLDRLLAPFPHPVQVLAVGTGQALRLAERKDVDAVLVHAPDLEGEALARGRIAQGLCLAENHFLLAGPEEDPARVREAREVFEALRRIARAQAPFVSRGDRSGTHLKELELWRRAGIAPKGPWYLESGAGMAQTLVLAAEKGAYTLTDLATFLTVGKKRGLKALYRREDPLLRNRYSYYPFLLYTSPMTVANHLTLNELRRRAKKAKDPIEKDRFLAVYHAKRGLTAKEIARIIPNTPRWVQATVRRYNLEGPEALKDKRHQNPGQKPKLTPEERMRVLEALQGPPPDGGLWTGPKLREWVERELGKRLSLYPIYRLLHEMGFALRTPRPRHRKADGEAQEAFKKTSSPRSRRRGPRGGG